MKRNPYFERLTPTYLFQEVSLRAKEYKKTHPDHSLIYLSIGDTSIPIPESVTEAMHKKADGLKESKTYSGYNDEQGLLSLREKISEVFYKNKIDPDEIFISDGAKCDLGRLSILFGTNRTIAIQDPSYPVYHDVSLAMGCKKLIKLPLTPENHFFPDLEMAKEAEILFFCSPHNPTGVSFSKQQLENLVEFARKHRILIVFDAAYNLYSDGVKSIYEIEGSQDVALEIGSFSKLLGFSGVRLGWSVVPKTLFHSLHQDWKRVNSTFFNGASIIAQSGGLEALSSEGMKGIAERVAYYKENAHILKKVLNAEVFGGVAPYLWVRFKNGNDSWALFDHFLENYGIVTTPGTGFGSAGNGFLRFSTLGKREDILEAAKRLAC